MIGRVALVLAGFLVATPVTRSSGSLAPGRCADMSAADQALSPSLSVYCMEFVPMDEFTASGSGELRHLSSSPFTVDVDAAGHPLYELDISLTGLPDPRSIGPYTTYVAWATTSTFDKEVKLGEVRNGRTSVGVVRFNRFIVMITAERSALVSKRSGRPILSATSPSWQLLAHDDIAFYAQSGMAAHAHSETATSGWTAPPMYPGVSRMVPGIDGLVPSVTPWLPRPPERKSGRADVPAAIPRQELTLRDGDSLNLTAGLIRENVDGRATIRYGFNGQSPGPLIRVAQKSTIVVNFTNDLDQPTSIHWHGVRLDNRFDGAPHVTQELVAPGGRFRYVVHFPDAGVYWYHAHQREDEQQNLGLYGNLFVRPSVTGSFGAVNREEFLLLSDVLMEKTGVPVPYGADAATHALMGRLGNVLLVNGMPGYSLQAARGEVVRFFLTNASSARVFNVSLPGARMKLIGSDVGLFEHERWVESVVLAPAERYIVEARFDSAGQFPLVNHVQATDHFRGLFIDEVDTLGMVTVAPKPASPDFSGTFGILHANAEVTRDIERVRAKKDFNGPPDHTLLLTSNIANTLPFPLMQALRMEASYAAPVEWSGTMPMMDWLPTSRDVRWILRDPATGRENMDIGWHFHVGDLVHLRLVNDRQALHSMQHPIHLHGQRFLVLAVNGEAMQDLSWKDTALVPAGSTVDLLIEMTNPGKWLLHCHIAEHLESGMRTVVDVAP